MTSMTKVKNLAAHFRRALDMTSDGCSGVPDFDFRECCDQHDFFYRNGIVCRAEADRVLRECIRAKGWVLLPWVYWIGVRIAGWRHYRWDKWVDWLSDIDADKKMIVRAVIDARLAREAAPWAFGVRGNAMRLAKWLARRALSEIGIHGISV